MGSHRIRSQRRFYLRRGRRTGWNGEDLLGRRGLRDVCGRGQNRRSGRVMPGAWQTGKVGSGHIRSTNQIRSPPLAGISYPQQRGGQTGISVATCRLPIQGSFKLSRAWLEF